MEKTIGEKRVRVDFNTKSLNSVDNFKRTTAELIDDCQKLRQPDSDPEQLRLISLAQTAYEEAAMWAVKAATFSK